MIGIWGEVSKVLRGLNPGAVAQDRDRPIAIALVAREAEDLRLLEGFLVPSQLRLHKAEQIRKRLTPLVVPLRTPPRGRTTKFDLALCSPGAAAEAGQFAADVAVFHPQEERALISEILERRWDLALPLARNFLPFRHPVQARWIRSISLENALFAAMTAVPDVVPTPFSLAWTAAGVASATAVLTANQVRLAFLLAAAADSAVGFQEQRGQITAITAAALGWRSLARELVGKMPGGRGLLAKALMAFAGTYVTGVGLERFHALGRFLTREEKSRAYDAAYRLGRKLLDGALETMAARRRAVA